MLLQDLPLNLAASAMPRTDGPAVVGRVLTHILQDRPTSANERLWIESPGGYCWRKAPSDHPARARAAEREDRVVTRGQSFSQSVRRLMFTAVAVATCCKWVFARPR